MTNTKPLTAAMEARLAEIKAAPQGRLSLPFRYRGAWLDGVAIDNTLQALIDRKLVKLVTLKAEGIVAGGMKRHYAKAL